MAQVDFLRFKGKKVFITGHTGFKGGWLLAIFHSLGAVVKGYALEPENKKGVYCSINGDALCESIIHDIRDQDKLERELIQFQPEFVFHLAAQPLVRASYLKPSETFDINIMGTSYLLEAVAKLDNKCVVVIVTTDKVYENNELAVAYKEEDRLGGFDPYSTSKACAELVVSSFKKSFFDGNHSHGSRKEIATARAGNVIGGGDFSKDRIIPDLVRSLEGHQVLQIRNPDSIRPWQHVLEPLFGYLRLALLMDREPTRYSNAFNFGPEENDHLTVLELVKEAIAVWGAGSWELIKHDQLHEAQVLKLDISKAKRELNWQPLYSSREAVRHTIEWYHAAEKRAFTFTQVHEYLKRVNEI